MLSTFSLLLSTSFMSAQVVLEVVTKTIERSFPYTNTGNIAIIGENASIKIIGSQGNEVKLTLKLISKNRHKEIAVEELNNIKYIAEKKGENIYLRNYFLERKEQASPGSILKVEYELSIPMKANVEINNNLGNVGIKNIDGKVSVIVRYGNVNLSNIKGGLFIDLSLGDATISQAGGTNNIKAEHSDIGMEDISGKCTFKLKSSDLSFKLNNTVEQVDVEARSGDITFLRNGAEEFNYEASSYYGGIRVIEGLKKYLHIDKNKSSLEKKDEKANKIINVKASYGNLIIKE